MECHGFCHSDHVYNRFDTLDKQAKSPDLGEVAPFGQNIATDAHRREELELATGANVTAELDATDPQAAATHHVLPLHGRHRANVPLRRHFPSVLQ